MAVAQIVDLAQRLQETKLSTKEATDLHDWLDAGGLTGLSDQLALELERKGAPAAPSPEEVKRALITITTQRVNNIKHIIEVLRNRELPTYEDAKGKTHSIGLYAASRYLAGMGYLDARVQELTKEELLAIFAASELDFSDPYEAETEAFKQGLLKSPGGDELDQRVKDEVLRRSRLWAELQRHADAYSNKIDSDSDGENGTREVVGFMAGAGYSWVDVQKLSKSEWAYLKARFEMFCTYTYYTQGFEAGLLV